MKIVIVVDSLLPALKYGGTQRVLWGLAKELYKRGHLVTFLAKKGSYCPFAKVIAIDPQRTIGSQIPEDADVVHLNGLSGEGIRKPYVITMHGNGVMKMDRNTVFVSRNHAAVYGE